MYYMRFVSFFLMIINLILLISDGCRCSLIAEVNTSMKSIIDNHTKSTVLCRLVQKTYLLIASFLPGCVYIQLFITAVGVYPLN